MRAIHHQPPSEGVFADIPGTVDRTLRAVLAKRGIARLYSHQAEAFDRIQAGKQRGHRHADRQRQDALLQPAGAQPAAQRPRRARHVPVPHQGAGRGSASRIPRAPSKRWAARSAPSPTTATRRRTRAAPSASAPTWCSPIPTCCTRGILPHHTNWARYFENLRYIVIDELHYYRGVYGSHLANLLRRLRASASSTIRKPQFICCSATIANPRELAEALTERAVRTGRAQRRAARREVFHLLQSAGGEPPARHPPQLHRRNAARGARIHREQSADAGLRQQPPGHRGPGHLSEGRLRPRPDPQRDACAAIAAAICRASAARSNASLRDGEIRAVVATNALELGIDIGSLDAVVMAGYPGTIASSWQRAGRAGRRQGTSRGGAGGLQRAARSVHRRASRLLLRALPGARLHQSGEPGDPAGPPQVRRLRAAHSRWREVRPPRYSPRSAASSKSPASCTTPPAPGTGPATPIPPTPPACAPSPATTSWWSISPTKPRSSPKSPSPPRSPRCTRRPSTCTKRGSITWSASITTSARPT